MRDKKLLVGMGLAIVIIIIIGVLRPRAIDWEPSFQPSDKIPYGTLVLYNVLPDIAGDAEVSLNSRSVYELLHHKHFQNTTLLFVQSDFVPTARERNELLAFAAKGNNLFISAGHLGHSFADTLGVIEKRVLGLFNTLTFADSAAFSQANFTNPVLHSDSVYTFKKDFFATYYKIYSDTFLNKAAGYSSGPAEISILGVDGLHRPNFVKIKYGRGYIYLHANPYAFTNYYILKGRGSQYAAGCLSYISGSNIIFDDWYKRGESPAQSPLRFILSREPLTWAFYTAMAFLLLFTLFSIKRRQRIIPVIDPFKNASLEFVQTIGSLYFNQSNHKNIARKKITYFFEHLRNRYGIDTTTLDDEFIERLSHKSGMDTRAIIHLVNLFTGIEQKSLISDTELIDLNHAIEYFNHNSQ